MEKISWNDHVRNDLLLRGKEESNIIRTIKGRECNWTGHILRRNCLPKYLIEGAIERIVVTVKRERRRKQLLDNPKKTNNVERQTT